MNEETKSKLTKILCYIVLAVLILFALITAIVLGVKHNQLDDANAKNEEVEKVLGENTTLAQNSFKFVLKNIDN